MQFAKRAPIPTLRRRPGPNIRMSESKPWIPATTSACRLHEHHLCGIAVQGVVSAVTRTRRGKCQMSALVARRSVDSRAGRTCPSSSYDRLPDEAVGRSVCCAPGERRARRLQSVKRMGSESALKRRRNSVDHFTGEQKSLSMATHSTLSFSVSKSIVVPCRRA